MAVLCSKLANYGFSLIEKKKMQTYREENCFDSNIFLFWAVYILSR